MDCYPYGTLVYILSTLGEGHLGSMRSVGSVYFTVEIEQLDTDAGCTVAMFLSF